MDDLHVCFLLVVPSYSCVCYLYYFISAMVGFLMGASMGVCGYLPSRYITVCSLGQATGGLVTCALQVGVLIMGLRHQDTALLYFSAATAIITLTLAAYKAMQHTVSVSV